MDSTLFDVIIIGGGPAGATTAFLLAEAGWSVAIVEKKNFPRRKVCGEFISATSFPLLEKFDILDFYLTHAGPEIKRVGIFARDLTLISNMSPANRSTFLWGRALGRETLDTVLLDKAIDKGATLWQPGSIKSIRRESNLSIITIESNQTTEQIRAKTVIMANGSWEGTLETSIPHHPSDLLAFKAHFKNSNLDLDLMPLLAFPGGYGGMVHTDDGRMSLSCCIRRDTLQQLRLNSPGFSAGDLVLDYISKNCLGVFHALFQASREDKWLAAGPIRPGIRHCYKDGIFFVGNIAGEAHPIIAEGISMAMQSAWLLTEILNFNKQEVLLNNNIDRIGQEYTKKWKYYFANRIYSAAMFAQLAMRVNKISFLLPLLKRFPRLITLGIQLSGKVKQVIPVSISAKLASTKMENTT